MMRHYCTLFDRNYLSRGLALHRSLLRHAGDHVLHVLCLDEATHDALRALALPRTKLLPLGALVAADEGLAAAQRNRSAVEFYFTCKPVLMAHVLDADPAARRVEYLDSDLYYFTDPSEVEAGHDASPVALSPHRFGSVNAHLLRYGRFNAGWIGAAATAEGRRFLAWWRERCLESCTVVPDATRYGDQKYLDQVPGLFPSTAIVSHPGFNAGPWSVADHEVSQAGGGVRIDGQPLCVFHFHAMKRLPLGRYETSLPLFGARLTPVVRDAIYLPYIAELAACEAAVAALPTTLRERLAPAAPGARRRLLETLRALRGLARGSTIAAQS
jgi:hypothetical protein